MPLTAEDRARERIDALLEAAGWVIQDMDNFNLNASLGVAIREFPTNAGYADYMLFVDKKAAGAIEAKPVETILSCVPEQLEKMQFVLDTIIPNNIYQGDFEIVLITTESAIELPEDSTRVVPLDELLDILTSEPDRLEKDEIRHIVDNFVKKVEGYDYDFKAKIGVKFWAMKAKFKNKFQKAR